MKDNPIKTWRDFWAVYKFMSVVLTIFIVCRLPRYVLSFFQGVFEGARKGKRQ